MDNNLIFQQLDKVEQRIEYLVGVLKSLSGVNAELEKRVTQLEEELQEKVELEKKYSEEKVFVRSRIDGLLAKLGETPDL